MGFGALAIARFEEAEGEVGLQQRWVRGDGGFVGDLGGRRLIEGVLGGAEIVKQLGVAGVRSGQGFEQADGFGVVAGFEGCLRGLDGGVLGIGGSGGVEVLRRRGNCETAE